MTWKSYKKENGIRYGDMIWVLEDDSERLGYYDKGLNPVIQSSTWLRMWLKKYEFDLIVYETRRLGFRPIGVYIWGK